MTQSIINIEILSSLKDVQFEHVVIEILSSQDLKRNNFILEKSIIFQAENNLKEKGEKHQTSLTFAVS